ncbi:MAG: isoaspartyl peptidase/L-asparaginase [Chloroflexi bacterium]|nr:isoaspartyl peptidase/L-asparaginase [Chloroflexota bacterium]
MRIRRRGGSALDAVEAAARIAEADPRDTSVGRGGWPNILGEVEVDASIMDGTTRRAGSVGAVRGYLYPISIARAVMQRLPHVMLVGDGAMRFAAEIGAERARLLTPRTRQVCGSRARRDLRLRDEPRRTAVRGHDERHGSAAPPGKAGRARDAIPRFPDLRRLPLTPVAG